MRSRFSAFCLADTAYLVATLHPSQRTTGIADEITTFAQDVHFCHLAIKSAAQTSEQGQVSFAAYFLHEHKLDVIEEVSDFVYDGRWYYKSGQLQKSEPKKIGRNDSCPCGSGKKFKQCLTHQLSGQLTDKTYLFR
ncbi:preprotein translocase SecA [Alishewanella longhuensis]|uniref:Preprotein translocase SecA n=2 Tax=Alishewanella longhuensis TaxID=1091037 RepID=A0ABQ3KYL5_9ALTE|nr:preprotein translocase SecA [Alishewanella longhuensis]